MTIKKYDHGYSNWDGADEEYARLRREHPERYAHGDPFQRAIDRLTPAEAPEPEANSTVATALDDARQAVSDCLFELSFVHLESPHKELRKALLTVYEFLNEWANKYGLKPYDFSGRNREDI